MRKRLDTSTLSNDYFLALGAALLLVAASFFTEYAVLQDGQTIQSYLGYLVSSQFSLLFIAMLVVWYVGPKSQNLADYKTLLIGAIIARILLFPIDPYMSNDVERYLFDGYIASIGLDPYTINHNDPSLDNAIDQWSPPIEHAEYTTLYPPVALALFTVAASFGPELAQTIWKVMSILGSLATLYIGALILQSMKKLQHLSLIALSPILILESGIGVHVDTFCALFVALAVWSILKYKNQPASSSSQYLWLTGVFIGLGTLTKILPIVLLAPLVIGLIKASFKQACYLLLAAMGTIILGYTLSFALGLTPIGSIGVFFEKFRFGSPYFYWLEQLLVLLNNSVATSEPWIEEQLILSIATAITSVIVLSSFIAVTLITWSKSLIVMDKNSTLAMQIALSLPLFFSPVVYSWYLAPLALLVALSPNLPLLVWLGLMPLTYEVLGKWVCCHEWNPAIWPLSLIAIGLALSFAYLFFQRQKTSLSKLPKALLI